MNEQDKNNTTEIPPMGNKKDKQKRNADTGDTVQISFGNSSKVKKIEENPTPEERTPSVDVVFPDEPEHDDDMTASETIVFPHLYEKNKNEDGKEPSSQKPTKKKHKKISVRKMLTLSRITVFCLIVANILMVLDVYLMTRYASLSQKIFYEVNIAVLVIILAIDLFCCVALTHKKKVWMTVILVIALLLNGAGGYALYALARINSSVSDLTATSYTKSVSAALVIYTGSDETITSVSDLDSKKVGIAEGTDTAEVAQEYLDNKGVTVTYESYNGYTALFQALINEEVAAAVLPVSYESLIDSDENLYSYYEQTSILASFSSDVQASTEAGADKDLTTEPFTVLISGENEGLADTIIVVSVNPISMTATMISIPRDSYVPITCYNDAYSKINSAHAVSESCLVDTVEQLTGITIDYTAEFTFASVIEIVDAVGGVDVHNDTSFDGQSWDVETDQLKVIAIPYDESGGTVHMNGEQALGFVRERYAFSDGDFARERHQQEVIQQVISKVMATRNPNMYLNLLEAAGDNLKTNLSTSQMLSFISYAMSKIDRYYNSSNPIGVFNFLNDRLTGYDSTVYDSSLGLDLYIYRLYDGAIADAYAAVEDNINLDETPSNFTGVSWSGAESYMTPDLIQDYYAEDTSQYDSSSSDDSYDYSYDNTYDNTTVTQNSTTDQTTVQEETATATPATDTTTDSGTSEETTEDSTTDETQSDTTTDDSTSTATYPAG
jgi:LCP family protein required for cell wall assembly